MTRTMCYVCCCRWATCELTLDVQKGERVASNHLMLCESCYKSAHARLMSGPYIMSASSLYRYIIRGWL